MEVVAFVMGGRCVPVGYGLVGSRDSVGEGCPYGDMLIVDLVGNEHCDESLRWDQLPFSWGGLGSLLILSGLSVVGRGSPRLRIFGGG